MFHANCIQQPVFLEFWKMLNSKSIELILDIKPTLRKKLFRQNFLGQVKREWYRFLSSYTSILFL